jgi:hypothetical protein
MKSDTVASQPADGRARRTTLAILLAALVSGTVASLNSGTTARAASGPDWGPQWTANGQLKLPQGYHTWIFLGSPLTPHGLNDGKAGFPEFHNVYIQPEAYQAYRNTGEFPEGTVLLKELQLTKPGTYADGSRNEASGRGYFPGKANGIDISVKDSNRFRDTNGWGFFNFGHHAPPYAQTAAVQPKEACAGCHAANATNMVFSEFYTPVLDAR